MAKDPAFASLPVYGLGRVTAANTNRDGTGALVDVVTGAAVDATHAGGTQIFRVTVQAEGTTTAGMVRLYLTNSGGTSPRLFDEVPVSAVTPSASVATFRAEKTYDDLTLVAGQKLQASTHNAETFDVWAQGGDL